jgi:DNA-binding transcriptional LysR family regulator
MRSFSCLSKLKRAYVYDISLRASRGIDIRHLHYTVLSADLRSFAKAADRLGIKAATLRSHVAYLEQRFAAPFFTRTPRGVIPTEVGQIFVDAARRVLEEIEGLDEVTRAVAVGTAGSLGIGFITSISAGNLRSSLVAFVEANPQIQLRCSEEDRQDLLGKLDAGGLDIVIISGSVSHRSTERLSLWSERMFVALPSGHRLADNDVVYWTELAGEIFLAPKLTADDIQAMVLTRLARPGSPPTIKVVDVSRETVLGVVGAGKGISLVSAGSTGFRMDNVVYRELSDANGPHNLNFSAYWRPGNQNPVLKTFLGFLRDRYSLAAA